MTISVSKVLLCTSCAAAPLNRKTILPCRPSCHSVDQESLSCTKWLTLHRAEQHGAVGKPNSKA